MADVFVSYKREDATHVRKLAAAPRAAGLDDPRLVQKLEAMAS